MFCSLLQMHTQRNPIGYRWLRGTGVQIPAKMQPLTPRCPPFGKSPGVQIPSKTEVDVTSIHVNIVGSRARVGFRFDAPHQQSHFNCTQDDLDILRSQKFPRQAHDQEFLDAAKKLLLNTFTGKSDKDLCLLAVDMGMTGAHASMFIGRNHQQDFALPIVKINKSYDGQPKKLERNPKDTKMRGSIEFDTETEHRGLRKEHLGLHLMSIGEGAAQIASHRQNNDTETTSRKIGTPISIP